MCVRLAFSHLFYTGVQVFPLVRVFLGPSVLVVIIIACSVQVGKPLEGDGPLI